VVSNWLSRIPAVQYNLRIEVGLLGLVLLAVPAGSVIAIPLASKLITRFGSALVTRISTLLFCGALALPGIAGSPTILALCLLVYGATAAAMDVAMNTQAVDVERGYGRPVMVSFHALFSVGCIAGSLMGSFAVGHAISPAAHLCAAGAAIGLFAIFGMRCLLPDQVRPPLLDRSARALWLPLLPLSMIGGCVLVGEGATGDWSALYLSRLAPPALAPLGYAVFSLNMALGRMCGDWFHHRVGPVMTIRLGTSVAAIGLAAALLSGGVQPALAGFACTGLGLSAIFPIVCSVAGKKAGSRPEAGIAAVTATGYSALLAGPPAIGFLAHLFSLRLALGLVAVLSAVAALLAPAARIER
jgi:MFS family permease